jgi:RNA polymerase sigma factor (sigma-70 family)
MYMDELPLLADYADGGSQQAFGALVDQYIDLVYSAARRQVRDAHLAEDVTQAVFIVLAQKAKSIPRDRPLSAWLLKTTSYTAANARRLRSRRQEYERKAAEMASDIARSQDDDAVWQDMAPMLDEGLSKLKAADRDALLLKFFEKKSLREVGEALGVSEEAAAKRVTRAVDKLRDYFERRGVAVTSAALGIRLGSDVVHTSPAGLSHTIAHGALNTGAATGTGATLAKNLVLLMTIKKAAVVAGVCVLLLSGTTAVVIGTKSMWSAPKTHQVIIDTPKSPWTATFSDGTALEVLGLSEYPPKDQTWWGADGSKLSGDSFTSPAFSGTVTSDSSRKPYIARFAFSGTDLVGKTFVSAFNADQGCIQDWRTDSPSSGVGYCIVELPADAKTDTLRLGMGRGEYQTMADIAINGTTTQPAVAAPDGSKVQILSVSEERTGTVIDIGRAFDHVIRRHERDEEIVAIVGGRPMQPWARRNIGIGKMRLMFTARKSEISKLVYRTRELEWVNVSNVSLTPQQKTNVTISAPASTQPVAAK